MVSYIWRKDCCRNKFFEVKHRGVIWGGWRAVAPPPPQEKGKRKKERKKEKRERKEKKREKRKKGTMNSVKLLHIKCCFFQFFNSPVAWKNKNKFCPQEKVEMTPLVKQLMPMIIFIYIIAICKCIDIGSKVLRHGLWSCAMVFGLAFEEKSWSCSRPEP